MTYIESFYTLCLFGLGLVALFGVVYPAVMIISHKLFGGKLTVREILRRI